MTETAPPRTGEDLCAIAQDVRAFLADRLIETRKGVTADEVKGETIAVLLVAAAMGQVEIAKDGGVAAFHIARTIFINNALSAYNGQVGATINAALAKK